MNSDFSELLKILNDGKIRYLIIGGYAVGKHAEPRYTKDLDIWISNRRDNAERVYEALAKFGSPLTGVSIEDFTDPTLIYQIGVEPSRIDVLMGLKELSFDDCWERRVTTVIDETETYFISIDDLIKNKRITGRPQDLLDAESLELKKKEQEKIDKPIG
ncbi:MAG: hypothetical protein M3449_02860 [Acidobacteriota bacterium]|nr:hypothetical protein [Blastocatellia bacterium]MDQ3220917.1 hypothetical protein [Acidobacteriota bacterium]MDQ3489994.1 hypothetical protein [Acidobacteriota bacterium]